MYKDYIEKKASGDITLRAISFVFYTISMVVNIYLLSEGEKLSKIEQFLHDSMNLSDSFMHHCIYLLIIGIIINSIMMVTVFMKPVEFWSHDDYDDDIRYRKGFYYFIDTFWIILINMSLWCLYFSCFFKVLVLILFLVIIIGLIIPYECWEKIGQKINAFFCTKPY